MKKEIKTCYDCGEEIEGEFYEYDGNYICQDCYENYYFMCEDCGKIEHQDNGYWIKDAEKLVCENCADNNYYCCEDCGEWYENTTYIEHHGEVCEHCFDYNDYHYCEDCGNYYEGDYMRYSEMNDCYYCDDCYGNHAEDRIYSYHEFNDWQLFKGNNEENPAYYIGKEIELEPKHYEQTEKLLNAINYINAVPMKDGSLSCGGVEVVTHPESWQYLTEHKEDYKRFFEEVERINYGDAGDAGLHFHVSRPNDNVISRVIVILESFKEEIKLLSRRNGNFSWSKFLTDTEHDTIEKIKYRSTKYIKDKYIKEYHDRYLALNLNNSRTIEFRFFNGANNFEEFWAALQFIHNVMEVALNEDRDINTITWKELIYGEELINQAEKLKVNHIEKTIKDTTYILEKIDKIKEEMKNDIKKTLKNFIKYVTKEMESKRLEILDKNDIDKIAINTNEYIQTITNDLRYLETITRMYRNIDSYSVNSIKNGIENMKDVGKYYHKENKYTNYFRQMQKAINKLEREVNE